MSAMTKSANKMAKSFERITEGGRKARRVLRQLGADAKKLPTGRGIGRAAGAEDGLARRGRDPHRIWGRGTMAQAGRDIGRFGRVSLGAMTSVMGVFADFDQKMGDVAAVTRGLEKDEFEAIRSKAKEIGEATKFTATEAASAFEMLGMAGLDAADQLKVIDHVMNLSAAGAMQLGQTTDIATDVMMGFNLEADQMGRIANVLAIGATSATTTIGGLGKGLAKVAPVASQLGVSLEESTAFLAAFANMGLKGGIGGRSLRRILISLVAPSKKASRWFRRLKIDTTDASGAMRRPVEIFQDMSASLRKLPEAKRIKALHGMFQAFRWTGEGQRD
jgi:TP901 family phage tail tape measure protein